MTDKMIDEFNKLTKEIPIPGYEGYRAIHPEIYKTLLNREKAISNLEGKQEGIIRAEQIVHKILNEI